MPWRRCSRSTAQAQARCIVTEGLFSMDGNIPDLPRIIELKKKYDCMLLVDEPTPLVCWVPPAAGVHEYFASTPTKWTCG